MKTFKQSLQAEEFVVTAQLAGDQNSSAFRLTRSAELLREAIMAVVTTDSTLQDKGMSQVAQASLLRNSGLDSIVELSCRGRNRIALTSELLGLRALGFTSVVVSEPGTPQTCPRPVHELDAIQLTALAESLNEQDAENFKELLIGTRCSTFSELASPAGGRLSQKALAGAQFLLTPVCHDSRALQQSMASMVQARLTWHYSVIASLACPTSLEELQQLSEIDGAGEVPPNLWSRIESASDPVAEGISMCTEMIRELKEIPGINGINLLVLNDEQPVIEALRRAIG